MFDLAVTVFFFFISLGVLVTIHEFGHFWVARRCGVRVEQFSIGFGTPLVSWTDKFGTEFRLAVLPLGGFVKMLDERTDSVSEEDKAFAFTSKTPWQRMAIILAGPVANFLLAIIIFWFIFLGGERGLAPVVGDVKVGSVAEQAGFENGMEIVEIAEVQTDSWSSVSRELFNYIGRSEDIPFVVTYPDSTIRYEIPVRVNAWLEDEEDPRTLSALGLAPALELEFLSIYGVEKESAAEIAGLRAEDRLITLNGEPIKSLEEFVGDVASSAGQSLRLGVERSLDDGSPQQLTIFATPRIGLRDGLEVGLLGVQLSSNSRYPKALVRQIEYGFLSAIPRAVQETVSTSVFVVKSIGKLVVGDLSSKNLSGPITIAKVAGDSARAGAYNFVRFVAILSIMLGVMNLLPVPVLDGGHILFILIELAKGSPVSERIQLVGYKAGFAMLIGLMVFATFNDLMRSF
jgi:regulator of sigma E protease